MLLVKAEAVILAAAMLAGCVAAGPSGGTASNSVHFRCQSALVDSRLSDIRDFCPPGSYP